MNGLTGLLCLLFEVLLIGLLLGLGPAGWFLLFLMYGRR